MVERGAELGSSASLDPSEIVEFNVSTTAAQPTSYFLVEVVYFASAQSSYKGTIRG